MILQNVRMVDLAQYFPLSKNLLELLLEVGTVVHRLHSNLFDSVELAIEPMPRLVYCAVPAFADLSELLELTRISLSETSVDTFISASPLKSNPSILPDFYELYKQQPTKNKYGQLTRKLFFLDFVLESFSSELYV
jgi:hypothetical protein